MYPLLFIVKHFHLMMFFLYIIPITLLINKKKLLKIFNAEESFDERKH